MSIEALSSGIRRRCPNCGKGGVYDGLLRFKRRCDVCEADFTIADAGDGQLSLWDLRQSSLSFPRLCSSSLRCAHLDGFISLSGHR